MTEPKSVNTMCRRPSRIVPELPSRTPAARPASGFLLVLLAPLLAACVSSPAPEELAEDYIRLGLAYLEIDRVDEAAGFLERASELAPELPLAGYNLARVYVAQGRAQDALDVIAPLYAAEPGNILIAETRAFALAGAGRSSEAVAAYRDILAAAPAHRNSLQNLALLLAPEQPAEALGYAGRLLDAYPTDREAALVAWELGESLDDPDLALAAARLLTQGAGAGREDSIRLAQTLTRQERFAEAEAELSALIAEEDSEELRFRLARVLYLGIQDQARAEELLVGAVADGFRDVAAIAQLLRDTGLDRDEGLLSRLSEAGFQLPDEEELDRILREREAADEPGSVPGSPGSEDAGPPGRTD